MKNFDCELEMIKLLFGTDAYSDVDRLLNNNTTAIVPSEYDSVSDSCFDVQEFSDKKTNCINIAEYGMIKHTVMVSG